jgi:glycosyl transferase family 25
LTNFTRNDLKVWVINLDRSPERMERMRMSLEAHGIAFTRFSAIDGARISESLRKKVDSKAYERSMGQYLLPGKVGCYYSHLSIWKELAASEYPVGLILEDDIVLHDDFVEALEASLSASECWDILRLNATRAKFPLLRGQAGRWNINGYIGRFTGNGCYLIKAEVAGRISATIENMRLPFEHEIGRFYAHGYRLAGLEPFPSHIEDFGLSQIVGENNSNLKKPSLHKRIPHFIWKVASYFRRAVYLNRPQGWPKPTKQRAD